MYCLVKWQGWPPTYLGHTESPVSSNEIIICENLHNGRRRVLRYASLPSIDEDIP